MRLRPIRFVRVLVVLAAVALPACGSGDDGLTIYSGRGEVQVKPLIAQFTKDTGIKVSVRYGDSAELAAQIAEEGSSTRADVFWSQDAGALGAVDRQGLLAPAPPEAAGALDPRFRAPDGTWVGISGRARVLIYNSRKVSQSELPATVFALTEPAWRGRIAIAPTNASFQAFVTAMRLQAGEARTRSWLEGIRANDPKTFEGNAAIVRAVNDGQVDAGLVNHYYLFELGAEIGADKLVARNHVFADGDPGALVNVSGVGILKSTDHRADTNRLVNYLLSEPAQRHFAEKNFEYPLAAGVTPPAGFTPLAEIRGPNINLADLGSLEDTLKLLREVGLL